MKSPASKRPRPAWKVHGLADVLAVVEKGGSVRFEELEPVMFSEPGFLDSVDVCVDDGHIKILEAGVEDIRYVLTKKGRRLLAIARRHAAAA